MLLDDIQAAAQSVDDASEDPDSGVLWLRFFRDAIAPHVSVNDARVFPRCLFSAANIYLIMHTVCGLTMDDAGNAKHLSMQIRRALRHLA
jgi:hypothetical protein